MLTLPFSLLMSVYDKECASFLDSALESVLINQTVKPAEIVVVEDGPIPEALKMVLEKYREKCHIIEEIANVQDLIFYKGNHEYYSNKSGAEKQVEERTKWISVRLKENKGLGIALNEGLKHCSYEWIARMDSDDISMPERFEIQWKYIEQHPDIDVLGCTVAEFERDPSKLRYKRICPENVEKYIKFRSPLNHPTVFFKKESVLNVGGYMHLPFMEDYFLWVRMFANKAKLTSVEDTLYLFRMTQQTQMRRGGDLYAKSENILQKYMLENNIISYPVYIRNLVFRGGGRFVPYRLRYIIYHCFLRYKI